MSTAQHSTALQAHISQGLATVRERITCTARQIAQSAFETDLMGALRERGLYSCAAQALESDFAQEEEALIERLLEGYANGESLEDLRGLVADAANGGCNLGFGRAAFVLAAKHQGAEPQAVAGLLAENRGVLDDIRVARGWRMDQFGQIALEMMAREATRLQRAFAEEEKLRFSVERMAQSFLKQQEAAIAQREAEWKAFLDAGIGTLYGERESYLHTRGEEIILDLMDYLSEQGVNGCVVPKDVNGRAIRHNHPFAKVVSGASWGKSFCLLLSLAHSCPDQYPDALKACEDMICGSIHVDANREDYIEFRQDFVEQHHGRAPTREGLANILKTCNDYDRRLNIIFGFCAEVLGREFMVILDAKKQDLLQEFLAKQPKDLLALPPLPPLPPLPV